MTLDKRFWGYYQKCPKAACFLYAKNPIFDKRTVTKKENSAEEEIFNILERIVCYFLVTVAKEEVEYKEIKKRYLLMLRELKTKLKRRDDYLEKYAEAIFYLRSEEPLKEVLEFIKMEDALNIETGSSIKILLNNFFRQKLKAKNLKNDYFYKLDVPLFSKKDGKITLFKFLHKGYPNFIYDEDCDLNLTRFIAEELFEEEVEKIVVYDFKSMARYEVEPRKNSYLADAFKIIRIVDMGLAHRNSSYENCSTCSNFENCKKIAEISQNAKLIEGEFNAIKAWKEKNE